MSLTAPAVDAAWARLGAAPSPAAAPAGSAWRLRFEAAASAGSAWRLRLRRKAAIFRRLCGSLQALRVELSYEPRLLAVEEISPWCTLMWVCIAGSLMWVYALHSLSLSMSSSTVLAACSCV